MPREREKNLRLIATYTLPSNSNSCFNAFLSVLSIELSGLCLVFLLCILLSDVPDALLSDTFQPQSLDVTAMLYLIKNVCAQTLENIALALKTV